MHKYDLRSLQKADSRNAVSAICNPESEAFNETATSLRSSQ
jgi:hypothetical protein